MHFKDLDYNEIDHDVFKQELLDGFRGLGFPEDRVSRLHVELKEGSVIAIVTGDVEHVQQLKAMPVYSMEVMGCQAAEPPRQPQVNQSLLMASAEAKLEEQPNEDDSDMWLWLWPLISLICIFLLFSVLLSLYLVQRGRFIHFIRTPKRDSCDDDEVITIPSRGKKQYDYFLSHKKHHSKHANQFEAVALSIHDNLKAKGYVGFFDKDCLETISLEALEDAVSNSATVVIFLHDETCTSEWCRKEWQCASDNDIPCIVIADVFNFTKQVMLDDVVHFGFPHLLDFQWVEYTETYREEALRKLASRIDKIIVGEFQNWPPHTAGHRTGQADRDVNVDVLSVLPGMCGVDSMALHSHERASSSA